jgi:hypothetical protein
MRNRSIQPLAGPAAYKTYEIRAPRSSHHRRATCAEADCPNYLLGWRTQVDETSELGQKQAHYIRHDSGRRFLEEQLAPQATVFTFEAGQSCFASDQHTVRLDRPELFVVKGGDWRGNPLQTPAAVLNPGSWVDDFGEHQERLTALIERG